MPLPDHRDANPIEIGLVLYPGAQLAAVLGMSDLFDFASRTAARRVGHNTPALRVSHWQPQDKGPPVRVFDSAPSPEGTPAVLVLPPSLNPPLPREAAAPLGAWLREQHAAGVALASVCAGAFVLGETGLLAGRTITTHWRYAEPFQDRFPGV